MKGKKRVALSILILLAMLTTMIPVLADTGSIS